MRRAPVYTGWWCRRTKAWPKWQADEFQLVVPSLAAVCVDGLLHSHRVVLQKQRHVIMISQARYTDKTFISVRGCPLDDSDTSVCHPQPMVCLDGFLAIHVQGHGGSSGGRCELCWVAAFISRHCDIESNGPNAVFRKKILCTLSGNLTPRFPLSYALHPRPATCRFTNLAGLTSTDGPFPR